MRTTKQVLAEQEQQANELTTEKALTNITPAAPALSLREQYLNSIAPGGVVGRFVKFAKGGPFVFSDNDELVDRDENFIAICDQTLISWVRFHEGMAPERIGGLLYSDFMLPLRETLGDTDSAKWSIGLNGSPEDPWKHEILLVLKRPATLELVTFGTTSQTGRRAVGILLKQYEQMRIVDAYPVVRLRPGGFHHRDSRIGWVATPDFAIVGRSAKETAAVPDTSLSAQMSDEVPF